MKHNLKSLLGLAIILGGLAIYVLMSSDDQNITDDPGFLLPALQDQSTVAGLTQINISEAGETTALTRSGEDWVVDGGFYADTEPMVRLISGLRGAQKLEAKTKNPENFPRLGLDDNGLRVTLRSGEDVIADVHLGEKGTHPGTAFVRMAGQQQSWLVNGTDSIQSQVTDWSLKTVLDHGPEDIAQVTIDNGSNDVIKVQRNAQSGQLEVVNLSDDQQLKANVHVSQFASGLSRFTIEEAHKVNLTDKTEKIKVSYQLTHGDYIKVTAYTRLESSDETSEQTYWATIDSDKYRDWMFKIPKYKFDALNKSLSEFVEPKVNVTNEDASEEEAPSGDQ